MKMTRASWLAIGAAGVIAVASAAWLTPKVLRRLDMQGLRPVTIATGLENPWSMAFLPDGRALVTERPGRMRIVSMDGRVSAPVSGLLKVAAGDEGGLLDVAIDPDFGRNGFVYWSFSEPDGDDTKRRSTAVARARLASEALLDAQVIFRQTEKSEDGSHFGSRLLFMRDGTMLVALGDRGNRPAVQDLRSTIGKIVRINSDGSAPTGNPFATVPAASPLLWTLGHRNIQSIAVHPYSGEVWAAEHGPQGGDELNIIRPGKNYGWPVITFGTEYTSNAPIGEGTMKDGMEQPVTWWGPTSIAPSGMTFLTSDRYPQWKGQMFIGTLRGRALVRIKIDGDKVVDQERLVTGLLERIRDVKQGPDGWLYILTHNPDGRLIRVER